MSKIRITFALLVVMLTQSALLSESQTAHTEALRQFASIQQAIQQVDETYVPLLMTVTAYAPLDPNAVEGMCFSGDPRRTASGHPSTPSRSVAMGRAFPFGTEVIIPALGFVGENHDRGSAIGTQNIDVMVQTRKEAFAIGRQELLVYVKVP